MEGDRSNARYWYRKAGRPIDRDTSAADEIRALRAELGQENK
jgi:G:T-mismatch repair DNA endonuclease (very short patch repair protein)